MTLIVVRGSKLAAILTRFRDNALRCASVPFAGNTDAHKHINFSFNNEAGFREQLPNGSVWYRAGAHSAEHFFSRLTTAYCNHHHTIFKLLACVRLLGGRHRVMTNAPLPFWA